MSLLVSVVEFVGVGSATIVATPSNLSQGIVTRDSPPADFCLSMRPTLKSEYNFDKTLTLGLPRLQHELDTDGTQYPMQPRFQTNWTCF